MNATAPRFAKYRELSESYSLIRLRGKDPVETRWKPWQQMRRDFDAIGFTGQDNAGIVCGPVSGLLVLDIDDRELFHSACHQNGWELPRTYTVRSGSGGHHHYFRYPEDGERYGNKAFKKLGFDIRGDGGFVVAAGSIHPNTGKPYEVEQDVPLTDAPEWLKELSLSTEARQHLTDHSELEAEPVELDSLPVSPGIKRLIQEGKPKGERSEAIMKVLVALVKAKVPTGQILFLFQTHAIGEKFYG